MSKQKETLLFIYNANNGLFSKTTDFAHKIISPSTYNCSLCNLTYGNFKMEKQWASFINSLEYKVEFSYRNETPLGNLGENYFPMLLLKREDEVFELLLTSKEINQQKTLDDLMILVESKL